jgi:hypothetical protein
MTSERSASVACDAVVANCENWSDTVCTAAPLATVVSAVTDVSTSTCGAPRKPARPPPAETEASVRARTSVSVSKYVCVDVARRDCDSALRLWRNEVCTDMRSSSERTRR